MDCASQKISALFVTVQVKETWTKFERQGGGNRHKAEQLKAKLSGSQSLAEISFIFPFLKGQIVTYGLFYPRLYILAEEI